MGNLSAAIASWLIRWRIPLFCLGVGLAIASLWPSRQLQFDRTIENVFPPGDARLAAYRRLKQIFGGNEIILAVYTDPKLFAADGSGIRRVSLLRQRLQKLPGVQSVLSIDLLDKAITDPQNELVGRIRKLFEGYTHGADGKTVALVCMLQPRESMSGDTGRSETVAAVREVMEDLPPPLSAGLVAGEPVMIADGYRFVEEDGRRLAWATTILLGAVIFLCFRSFRWVIVPIVIVQLTLLWTKALLALLQLQLSMVSSMLTAVVTVVGIATVVHVIVRFREARHRRLEPPAALREALAILALPIFWACMTDAAGFGSLMVTRVGPVQDFGLMMAIGSLLVIASVAMVLPTLVLSGSWASDPRRAWGEQLMDVGLDGLVRWVEHHPGLVGSVSLLVFVLASVGVWRLEVESDFTKNFRQDSQIVRSYEFVEENLGGAGVWDVIIPAPQNLDYTFLQRVLRLEQRLNAEVSVPDDRGQMRPGLTKTLSLADAVTAFAPGILDDLKIAAPPLTPEGLRPALEARLREAFLKTKNAEIDVALFGMRERIPNFYEALHSQDPQHPGQYWLRVMLRSHERQSSKAKREIIEKVDKIAREEFPAAGDPQHRLPYATGFFVLLAYLIDNLLADQWLAFLVATGGILLMMLFALRNPLYALVALVPNVAPIMIVTGLMGWMGYKINMGAAMIAAVSMGLSIDSSIHYILSFQTELAQGKSVHGALAAVHHSVGRALIFSTLALIAGFIVLCFSEFVPTIYFGALVSLTMIGGLAGNLVVLPLLLRLVTRESKPPA